MKEYPTPAIFDNIEKIEDEKLRNLLIGVHSYLDFCQDEVQRYQANIKNYLDILIKLKLEISKRGL